MRIFHLVMAALLCVMPPAGHAGAWLKDEGRGFSSVSFSMTWFRDTAQTSYLEYGLRDDLTIGLDMGLGQSRLGQVNGFALAFFRRPIGDRNGAHRFAYELGLGAAWIGPITSPIAKTGVSWGHGFQVAKRDGWVNIDAAMIWDLGYGLHLGKLDGTVGLSLNDSFKAMMQVYTGHIAGESFATIAPSIVISPFERKNISIQIGAETEIGNSANSAIKIGLWRTF